MTFSTTLICNANIGAVPSLRLMLFEGFFSIPIPNGYGDWDGGISMHFTHIPNVSTYTVHLHIYYKPILVASLDLFL